MEAWSGRPLGVGLDEEVTLVARPSTSLPARPGSRPSAWRWRRGAVGRRPRRRTGGEDRCVGALVARSSPSPTRPAAPPPPPIQMRRWVAACA
nr:unnamed protein product [Digitaria exilis]